ncbi:MAG TPA: PQQ-binding-like beta-propeller repeat protein [Gemmatimonadaceae bacterium]|nr:PQQ-binding-like beta-propeller repeat protein [Gemmatimonadaceae bacterium]
MASQAGQTLSAPAAAGNTVVFGAGDGSVIARDIFTGVARWSTVIASPGRIQGASILIAGNLVIAEADREVVALDLVSGAVRWRYQPPLDTTNDGFPGYLAATHPAVDGSHAYVPAWGASVSAVSLATGTASWVWRLGRLPTDTAANVFRSGATGVQLTGDTVLVAVWHWMDIVGGWREAFLVALDRVSGTEFWRLKLPPTNVANQVEGAPLVVGDMAIVGSAFAWVVGVRLSTRQVVWSYRSPDYKYSTSGGPAAYGNYIYADGGDLRLYALNVATGTVVWSAPLGDTGLDIVATDKRVYVPGGHTLTVVDRATGASVKTIEVPVNVEIFESAAAAKGDQIFITRTRGAWSFREP